MLAIKGAENYNQQVAFLTAVQFAYEMCRGNKPPTVALLHIVSLLWDALDDEQKAGLFENIYARVLSDALNMAIST